MTDQTFEALSNHQSLHVSPAHSKGLPHAAAVLAYAGALPLIVAALLVVLRKDDFGAVSLGFMALYGGALITFFGGVRWGVAVMRPDGPTFRHLLGAILPLLIAMPVFVFDDMRAKFVLIVIALPILLFDDLRATRAGSGAPDWYLGVRTPLTILMEFSFLFALAALLAA